MKHLKKVEHGSEVVQETYDVVYYSEESDNVILKSGGVAPFNGHEYVDLGLPNGLKWATCNVRATKPEEYGLYFQWGDTVGYEGDVAKAHSTWSTTPFNNGSSSYDSTYFASVSGTVCPNGVLAAEYDAAHVHMGGDWRMPTSDEVGELIDNTTSEWVENYNNSGVNGILFTSTINSNSIFIPASGDFDNGNHYNTGSGGFCWSSSLLSSDPGYAHFLNLFSSDVCVVGFERFYGFPMRGVCK